MQSQQKKVKWSRGETAKALEERTDTGITEVSVDKMENIIADIYGNISRRPALKIIDSVDGVTDIPVIVGGSIGNSTFVRPPQSFVFTIDANTYIIFIAGTNATDGFGGLLIQNNKFVRRITVTNNTNYNLSMMWDKAISTAQYNNFMVISNLYTYDVIFRLTGSNINTYAISVVRFNFSAPWYAPNGTTTQTIGTTEVPGLEFNKDGLGFTGYSYTDGVTATQYYLIDTGITTNIASIEDYIPVGSIVQFPKLGTYMRVEGYTLGGSHVYFPDITFDTVSTTTVPSTGYCALVQKIGDFDSKKFKIMAYYNGVLQGTVNIQYGDTAWVQCSASATGYSQVVITRQWMYDYYWEYSATWADVSAGSLAVQMFGALLTPVANDSNKDSTVTVETGYISLNEYQPTKFTFSNQRLYASGFYNADLTPKQIPGYAVGSQIGRYNDFKNDYNTQSEAITIDISTSYQEQVVALVDYNGVKILTDAAEYAYINGGVVKQSENGSLADCKPLVFGSVCLYADKSGGQIRAIQYELQTDLFNSSIINQMTQEDLIFHTNTMGGFVDKEHCTGHFLFAVQTGYNYTGAYNWTEPKHEHSMAVCNFVPGNQATIWTRWNTPDMILNDHNRHTIANIIEVNNKVWFVVNCLHVYPTLNSVTPGYTLAELDYDGLMDLESTAQPTDTNYMLVKPTVNNDYYSWSTDHPTHTTVYTTSATPAVDDPVYYKFDNIFRAFATITSVTSTTEFLFDPGSGVTFTATKTSGNIYKEYITIPGTISVFDGDEYKWDDTLTMKGEYTQSLAELTNPRIGFMVNAELVSHPLNVGAKTYTDHKRIGKAVAVIRDTQAGAFTVCGKTGYTSEDLKTVNFYGCTGMKNQVRYTIRNIQGAKFTIESLTMIIEYATLDS